MKNRRKKQIKKLVSSLCTVGTLGSYSSYPTSSRWSKLGWCDVKTSRAAANHLIPCIRKVLIPLINEKARLNLNENTKIDFEDDEWTETQKKVKNCVDKLITDNNGWIGFVDIIIAKYRATLGVLTKEEEKVLDAFSDALHELNENGDFDPHGLSYPKPPAVRFSSMVSDIALNFPYIGGHSVWWDEIKYKLQYQTSPITKSLIGLGIIAGGVTGGSALISKSKSWRDDRRQQKLLEHKAKFQRQEDQLAQLFADKVDIDPKKINVDKLRSMLETEAMDWPYAAEELNAFINIYIGIIIAKQDDPLAKCPPIILIGPPGCGKSEWVKRVIKSTFACIEDDNSFSRESTEDTEEDWKERCIFINQDKIDIHSSVSPRDQISGTHEEKREDVTVTCYSDSAKANKFGKGVNVKNIDEIEKLPVDVILSIWDTADSGGRSIVLATANGNPADYVEVRGASFKEAFVDRAIIMVLPAPTPEHFRDCIEHLIAQLNEKNPDKAPIVISKENLDVLVNVCTSNRSVQVMRSPMLGLQRWATNHSRSSTPIKVNPKKPKSDQLIIDESYPVNITPIKHNLINE